MKNFWDRNWNRIIKINNKYNPITNDYSDPLNRTYVDKYLRGWRWLHRKSPFSNYKPKSSVKKNVEPLPNASKKRENNIKRRVKKTPKFIGKKRKRYVKTSRKRSRNRKVPNRRYRNMASQKRKK